MLTSTTSLFWIRQVSFLTRTFDLAEPLITQAGTFWYHSHVSTQYCDGLRGPFVVYDPHDPYAHLYDVDNGWFGL